MDRRPERSVAEMIEGYRGTPSRGLELVPTLAGARAVGSHDMWLDRERVEARLNALVADFLDSREESMGDQELDLGVVALVAEVRERRTPEEIEAVLRVRRRPEAEYTPEAEWTQTTWYRCTDLRDWIAGGLFRRAMLIADGFYDDDVEDEEDSERPE